MEGATYIVEEEFLHLDSNASIQDTDNQIGTEAEAIKVVKAMDMGTVQEDMEVALKGHHVLAPPTLTSLPELCHVPPPLFNTD